MIIRGQFFEQFFEPQKNLRLHHFLSAYAKVGAYAELVPIAEVRAYGKIRVYARVCAYTCPKA
jgi:hypothetical protein